MTIDELREQYGPTLTIESVEFGYVRVTIRGRYGEAATAQRESLDDAVAAVAALAADTNLEPPEPELAEPEPEPTGPPAEPEPTAIEEPPTSG